MSMNWPDGLNKKIVDNIINAAFEEDIGKGDLTSEAVISKKTYFTGIMSARDEMVCAGIPIAGRVFGLYSEKITWTPRASDGDKIEAGSILANIEGPAIDLLTAERTAINILQHLSGIATLTSHYAEKIADLDTILLDTRKTIPAYRHLAKYATRMGGATNHRMSLDDGVLIKDNHIAVSGGIREAIKQAKAKGLSKIEVECDTLEQVKDAVESGADMILFDNMNIKNLKVGVKLAKKHYTTEASGNINLKSIKKIAATGVDRISIGSITHSVTAMDLKLEI